MIGLDIARSLDPVLLARDCGIEPDPWQADLLRSDRNRIALCCSRQTGKSTCCSILALHESIYTPDALVVVVSPSQRQSGELFRSIMRYHAELKDVPTLTQSSALRAELSNGSRILAMPGSERTVRGLAAVTLLIIDEAARVDETLLAACRPMLATSNGRLVILSTPKGRRGFFFEVMHSEGDDWLKVRVPATECPRISQEFLDEELREMGRMRFDEEYMLLFADDEMSAFPSAIIENAFTTAVRPLWG